MHAGLSLWDLATTVRDVRTAVALLASVTAAVRPAGATRRGERVPDGGRERCPYPRHGRCGRLGYGHSIEYGHVRPGPGVPGTND